MARMTAAHALGWQIDEVAVAGRENLDPAHVARYDAKEDAAAAAEVSLLGGLGLGPDSVVVDIGAGTGQFSLAAAPLCRRVVAVDVSPVMLAALRARVAAAGLDNVEVVQAGFLSYEHEGPAADFVYSRYALHHLPDFWKGLALTRAAGILRPGGVLRLRDVAFAFEPAEAADRIEAWRAAVPETAGVGDWVRADVDEHLRDEHSTFTWLLEPMIRRSGFAVERADYTEDGIVAAYVLRTPRPS